MRFFVRSNSTLKFSNSAPKFFFDRARFKKLIFEETSKLALADVAPVQTSNSSSLNATAMKETENEWKFDVAFEWKSTDGLFFEYFLSLDWLKKNLYHVLIFFFLFYQVFWKILTFNFLFAILSKD